MPARVAEVGQSSGTAPDTWLSSARRRSSAGSVDHCGADDLVLGLGDGHVHIAEDEYRYEPGAFDHERLISPSTAGWSGPGRAGHRVTPTASTFAEPVSQNGDGPHSDIHR